MQPADLVPQITVQLAEQLFVALQLRLVPETLPVELYQYTAVQVDLIEGGPNFMFTPAVRFEGCVVLARASSTRAVLDFIQLHQYTVHTLLLHCCVVDLYSYSNHLLLLSTRRYIGITGIINSIINIYHQ